MERQETEEFLRKLRQFAAETKFDEFFRAQGRIYEQGIRHCESVRTTEGCQQINSVGCQRFLGADLGEWLGEFFGVENTGELKLVLGFVNGFSNYGVRFEDGRTSEKYAIMGMRPFDQANTVIFLPQQIETVAHEFCHSFANPVVKKYMDQLQPAGERLFASHGPAMRMRGYQKWESVMYETAVRACVGVLSASALLTRYTGLLPETRGRTRIRLDRAHGRLPRDIRGQSGKYPTFESFFAQFVTCLTEYSEASKR